jgi:quercetin dioxygenase-like cupin family protein
MAKRKNEKYIISELKGEPEQAPEAAASYAKWAKHVLWLNDKVVPGAYNMMFGWYLKPQSKPLPAHTHDNPEILIFLGSNPEDPYDLGGEIEFWMEDEKYNITKSTFIWVPRGMKHCPMFVKRVDRPIIHLGSSVKPGYKV